MFECIDVNNHGEPERSIPCDILHMMQMTFYPSSVENSDVQLINEVEKYQGIRSTIHYSIDLD